MSKAMIIHTFTGDNDLSLTNRVPNEIVFTARGSDGTTFSAIVPAAMLVQVLAPVGRGLVLTAVTKDGEAFHAHLARFDDEPPLPVGVYLCSFSAVVYVDSQEFTGAARSPQRVSTQICRLFRGRSR